MTGKTISKPVFPRLTYSFPVIPPFKPGAGSVQAGVHPLDSRFRGNDD